jgi:glycosyltransferase involved in cell wall biosynthesis
MMQRSARVIAVAEIARQEAIRTFRLPEALVITIPNAVDRSRLTPTVPRHVMRAQLDIRGESPVGVFVGAMTWEKDPLGCLEITTSVLRALPESIQLFVGDGPLMNELRTSVSRLRLHEQVRLLGKRNDVANILGASDLMVFASRTQGMEGMPACVIEAGMAGIPVAAYAVAGVPEVVVDGVTGRLATPGDRHGLAKAMLSLLSDRQTRVKMGREAQARCKSEFAMDSVAPRYLNVYEELLNGKDR